MAQYCNTCSMQFQDERSLQGHCTGKKHLKRLHHVQVIERSIFVSSLPKSIPAHELLNFFQQYGAIKCHHFGPTFLIIEFCDRNSTEALLNKPVFIKNIRLNIKRRSDPYGTCNRGKSVSVQRNNHIRNTDPISYVNIKHVFEADTFDNQLILFLNAVQLTDTEIEMRYEPICQQLNIIFKAIFPKCKTYRFGSTQTGLSFKDCDLDIYMDIGVPIYKTTNASTNSWTMGKTFKVVRKFMFKRHCYFSNIILIPKAKTPIIKFCYVPTNVSCDISFKNGLSIYKTYLMKYFISLDNRLRPLTMLIKYWGRHFKAVGRGEISNYALVLLIIFYLQQPSVNILPPLTVLQKVSQPQIINGWQVNFDVNAVLPPVTNKSSIPQLLHGFFSFYATFEFKSRVLCPLDGMVHTESEFKDIENLPQCMDRYKVRVKEDESLKLDASRPMCVQDPTELNHNITASIQPHRVCFFVRHCAITAEICEKTSENDYRDLMKTLLTTQIKRKNN